MGNLYFSEIAWVGKNEKQLKDEGINYSVGQFLLLSVVVPGLLVKQVAL